MYRFGNIFNRLFSEHGYRKGVLFISISFCILAISITFFALSIDKPFMGTRLTFDGHDWTVQDVDPNGLASQAGIEVGDSPIEINGQPASLFLEKYREAGMVLGILIKELTVVDESHRLKSVNIKNNSLSPQSRIEQACLFFICLVFWITGFYTFLKRPKNLAAFLLCLCGLTFGMAICATIAGESLIPVAFWLAIISAVVGPWLLLHFFLALPEERIWPRNNPKVYLIYIPAAITLVLFPIIGYDDGQPAPWFRTVRLLEYGVGFLAVTGVAILNYFHATSIKTQQQMKIVLVSCLAALIPFLALYILPEAIWRQTLLPESYNILFIVFIPLGMGYAVVTTKLMDIDVVIRRGITYGLITLLMAVILSAAIFAVVTFQKSLAVPHQIFISLALSIIALALFVPIRKWGEILIDKLFYKDRYDYRQMINSLSTSLNSLKEITDISRFIVGATVRTLNLAGGCLFVEARSGSFEVSAAQGKFANKGKQRQLVALVSQRSSIIEFPNQASGVNPDVAFLIPLVAGGQEDGILCLSPKLSRQDFSSDDIYLLQGLASAAATALHSAILIRDVSIRDTFVSIASHELRTPLTAIIGYTELLLRRDPSDVTRKKWLKNILENGQRITAMVDDLLNITRIQSGKATLRLERVKLSDLFKERLAMIQESTDKHEFMMDIEPNLPDVVADRDKFGQVIGNLLSNAVKYSPNGGQVTLSAHNELKRHRIVVGVADEGIGISPEDKDSLFTTFHRIQRPETQGIGGTGLGLYIAKEWIEAMGGAIWLESELDQGSIFFVAIPTYDSNRTD